MTNLYIAFLQENIKPEQVAKAISQVLNGSDLELMVYLHE